MSGMTGGIKNIGNDRGGLKTSGRTGGDSLAGAGRGEGRKWPVAVAAPHMRGNDVEDRRLPTYAGNASFPPA